jgi:predicted phage terminase large subunit-like protein
LITSDCYQRYFSDRFQLAGDRNKIDEFSNDKHGSMLAVSVGSSVLGRGGDILVLDDPLSVDMALSDAERKTANNWIFHTFANRLNDPSSGAIIGVMQRVHEQDTTGLLLEAQPNTWTHIVLPLEAESDSDITFPISGKVWHRQKGDILIPQRFSPKVVEQLRSTPMTWAGQFQQRPAPLEGNLIRRDDICYHGREGEPLPGSFDRIAISVDCSFKDKSTSDYVAVATIGAKGSRRYVLNMTNAHLDVSGTENTILRQLSSYKEAHILIESKASGDAVIQRLKTVFGVANVHEVTPQGGKVARFAAMAPEWDAHDWYLSKDASWTESLIAQLLMFPNGRNDDMCDALSQTSIWLQSHSSQLGLIEALKMIDAAGDDISNIPGINSWDKQYKYTNDGHVLKLDPPRRHLDPLIRSRATTIVPGATVSAFM